MSKHEMVNVSVGEIDVDLSAGKIVDLIAALQGVLDSVPAEFRDVATVNFAAYDWEGIFCEYERPMTDEEYEAQREKIERQRLAAAKAAENREIDEWLRNIRLSTGMIDRDEAMNFLKNNPDANNYHPSVYRAGRHGHA